MNKEQIQQMVCQSVDEHVQKLNSMWKKIVFGLAGVVLLETGALIYGHATDRSDIKHLEASHEALTKTVNEFVKSSQTYNESLIKITVENKTRIDGLEKSRGSHTN
jgi:hypothetical protein